MVYGEDIMLPVRLTNLMEALIVNPGAEKRRTKVHRRYDRSVEICRPHLIILLQE